MSDKIVSPDQIRIYNFSENIINRAGQDTKAVLNRGSIEKKINNIEDAIYYLKVFAEVLQRLFNKQKRSSYVALAKYDALMVLQRDVAAAIVKAYNNKEGNL